MSRHLYRFSGSYQDFGNPFADNYQAHRSLCNLFGQDSSVVYRVEHTAQRTDLLVLSDRRFCGVDVLPTPNTCHRLKVQHRQMPDLDEGTKMLLEATVSQRRRVPQTQAELSVWRWFQQYGDPSISVREQADSYMVSWLENHGFEVLGTPLIDYRRAEVYRKPDGNLIKQFPIDLKAMVRIRDAEKANKALQYGMGDLKFLGYGFAKISPVNHTAD